MRLYELLDGIAAPGELDGVGDFSVSGIHSDSREELGEGSVFVAIKGERFDGHDAVPQLSKKGVGAFIVERSLGLENEIIVENSRLALSRLWANYYHNPERELRLIGVTGTNGKTTTVTVIKGLLTLMGRRCGLIGTCGCEIGDELFPSDRTTPEPKEFFSMLDRMRKSGCTDVVMEVSSQGLSQYRLADAFFELAVFTNLTQDHLDVHGSMESYYQAKKLLFSRCGRALINIDDSYGKRLAGELSCPVFSYSCRDFSADYSASGAALSARGSEFWYSSPKKSFKTRIGLPGSYNISNCLAALASCELLGCDPGEAVRLIAGIKGVRGRFEPVDTGRDFHVIIDYAHRPDALENVLSCLKELAKGRIVCLFGCGGNRDAKKRPLMAKAAAKYADLLVITSDNPRDEEPHSIIVDILEGLRDTEVDFVEIDDRREAIFWAVTNARSEDIILLAGKGHEDYQILPGGVKIHFDEREIVNEALKA